MNGIDYITVKGFKSIASIEKLELGPITLLIGPNGSGKSNFIGAFSFLNAIRESRLQEYVIRVGGADRVLHFGSRNTEKLHIHISFQDERSQYQIELMPSGADELAPKSETSLFWDKANHERPFASAVPSARPEAGISGQHLTGVSRMCNVT